MEQPLGDLFLGMKLGSSNCMGSVGNLCCQLTDFGRSLLLCREGVTEKHLVALGKLKCWRGPEGRLTPSLTVGHKGNCRDHKGDLLRERDMTA